MTQNTAIEEIICSRRTIKQFKSDPISIETIKELLEVAVWAPNHKLHEPCSIPLFSSEHRLSFLRKCLYSFLYILCSKTLFYKSVLLF